MMFHRCPEINHLTALRGFFPREAKGVKYRKSSCFHVDVQVASGHVRNHLHLAMPRPAQSSSWIHTLHIYFTWFTCIRRSVNEMRKMWFCCSLLKSFSVKAITTLNTALNELLGTFSWLCMRRYCVCVIVLAALGRASLLLLEGRRFDSPGLHVKASSG